MPPKTKSELELQRIKLAHSYSELLEEFSSKELRHVGNYTLDKLIGKGSFGKVYLAKHNLTNGTKVVLKSSRKDDSNLAREIHHHRQFLHPHIARLYEVIVTENLVWLALEYCPGDELYNYLLNHGALPVDKVQKIFTQLVGAVAYIHGKSCVHRDLKLENVLLDKNENVKLCDFGFTREYEGKANYLQTFCGTVCYSAPEMLKGEKYAGEKVDVWSLGIILYALIRGELPFDEDDDQLTKAKILKDDPKFPEDFPEDAKSLIKKLLSKRPLYRPTLSDIMTDPFLAEFAPAQQAILKVAQPPPFTTDLEKLTLERMKSAGVDIDRVIENVLAQRCDSLAGWWSLLIEKEQRKEIRRERRRKEREAEIKMLRRLSGASGRFDRMAPPTLHEVDEEGRPQSASDRARSSSRGRKHRRSTPQILVTDLPQLPEGAAVGSPGSATPPAPIDKDSVRSPIDRTSIRSPSTSRPPPPPKERKRRSSTLQMVVNNPDLLAPPAGTSKGRQTKKHHLFLNQLASLKHWLVESTKRARSPGKLSPVAPGSKDSSHLANQPVANGRPSATPAQGHTREMSSATNASRSSYGAVLTPTSSHQLNKPALDMTRTRRHRDSLSPAPLTPHSARRGSSGLRGRKSTASSLSSVRSMPRHQTHSKASSASSNSYDNLHSPVGKTPGRSPRSSIKVLPATPTTNLSFSSSTKQNPPPIINPDDSATPTTITEEPTTLGPPPPSGLVFARRKKTPFSGPKLNGALFGLNLGSAAGQNSPSFRAREGSAGRLNLGLHDLNRSASARAAKNPRRKSQIIEEEEEEEADEENEEEEVIEEVDNFEPVDLAHGERVHSITVWDDGHEEVEAERNQP